MTARFYTERELREGAPGLPDPRYLFYTARGPAPAPLLVWRHPRTRDVLVRFTTMTPLSWQPFSMAARLPIAERRLLDTLGVGDTCVMAWGGRDLARASYLAALDLPANVDLFQIARLQAVRSPYGDVPHVANCPLNVELRVDRFVDYGTHRFYFLLVEYLSLDEEILPLARREVLERYHLYEVDRPRSSGGESLRLAMAGDIHTCPTFPVGPKQGWYSTFPAWIGELRDEGYLSAEEHATVIAWHDRWLALFENLESPERATLRTRLTALCQALAWQEWERVHRILAEKPPSG